MNKRAVKYQGDYNLLIWEAEVNDISWLFEALESERIWLDENTGVLYLCSSVGLIQAKKAILDGDYIIYQEDGTIGVVKGAVWERDHGEGEYVNGVVGCTR